MSFESNVRENWPDKADTVLGLIRGTIDPDTFVSVQTWVRQCLNPPSKHERIAEALNEVLEAFGVEAIFTESDAAWPELEYLNFGDTYDTTLIYDYGRKKWRVGCWGDEVERRGL